jgi:hypothetical protein
MSEEVAPPVVAEVPQVVQGVLVSQDRYEWRRGCTKRSYVGRDRGDRKATQEIDGYVDRDTQGKGWGYR